MYRMILYDHSEEKQADENTGRGARPGISKEKVEAVIEDEGELPITSILRCRVRYFYDGAVFGTTQFVNSVFDSQKDKLRLRLEPEARKMKGDTRRRDLQVMRDLRGEVVG